MGYKMSNMTLDEAIEHCKKVAKEQENCNVGFSRLALSSRIFIE